MVETAAVAGQTRRAVFSQPDWLRAVPTGRRLPEGARVVHTGCGTSFHAAQTGGRALQALEAVLQPPDADVLVCVSHEGGTQLTLEAARAFPGEVWLVTGTPVSPLAAVASEVVVCTPELERSWCHTASYTCAVAAIAALHGRDVSGLPDAV
jgi:glucosamine 6-phosphate synthetase-like amidotransferase/phosphosugar isomerase protein